MELLVPLQCVRTIWTNLRALDDKRKIEALLDRRVYFGLGVDSPNCRFPVLTSEDLLKPLPLGELGSVAGQHVPHTCDLAVLRTVGCGKDMQGWADVAGIRHFFTGHKNRSRK
jgi:hypothetical protein